MTMRDPEVKISISNISFSYGGPEVLKNVSLDICAGRIHCLMGINGCGKSTLIDCVLGMHEPAEGEILIGGKRAGRIRPSELAKQIAYVPQVHDRSFPYKVRDIVLMGRTAWQSGLGSPDSADMERCEQEMERCGIAHLADRPYTRISGGEMQMVMLARALAQDAPVIVMDEPTAHLDFRNELIFLETVVRLVRERSIGVLIATHSPNQAFYFENAGVPVTTALMADHTIRASGAPSEVLTEKVLRETYEMDVRVADVDLDGDGVFRQIIPVRTHREERQ